MKHECLITIMKTVKAVLYDGSQETWDDVVNLDWSRDACYVGLENLGVMMIHHDRYTIEPDGWIYVNEGGTLSWAPRGAHDTIGGDNR